MMRNQRTILIALTAGLLVFSFTGSTHAKKSLQDQPSSAYAPGEVIVKFQSSEASTNKSANVSSKNVANKNALSKPKGSLFANTLKSRIQAQRHLRMMGRDFKRLTGVPPRLKGRVKDQGNVIPVFRSIHTRMRNERKTERELNTAVAARKSAVRAAAQASQKASSASTVSKEVKSFNLSNVYRIPVVPAAGQSIEALCQELAKDPAIEYCQPNYVATINMIPNEPTFSGMWPLKPDKLNAAAAWDIAQGEGVVVGVVDTGVDYNHPDIWNNIWVNPAVVSDMNGDGKINLDDADMNHNKKIDPQELKDHMMGWDFVNADSGPFDDNKHGTHVSGTIAATANNTIGYVGVAPQSKIMAMKALNAEGNGYLSDLAAAIVYAAENGAQVISNSWGFSGRYPDTIPVLQDAIDQAYDPAGYNAVIVFAAGNSNDDIRYYFPQNYYKVITVAATDSKDRKAYFSNWGYSIDVAAPGQYIMSLMPGGYGSLSGTSMACPHVVGLAALILSHSPDYTNEQVRQAIRKGADDIGTPGWDLYAGYGRIDAFQSLMLENVPSAVVLETQFNLESALLTVSGVASGPGFRGYHLVVRDPATGVVFSDQYYTQAVDPVPAGQPIGILAGPLSVDYLKKDGVYLVDLIVDGDGGAQFKDVKPIEINHLIINTPLSYESFPGHSPIQIAGRSDYSYVLQWALGEKSATDLSGWKTDGVIQGDGVTSLGQVASSALPQEDGFITIKAVDVEGNIEIVKIFISTRMKSAWPIDIGEGYDVFSLPLFNIDDLDGNGMREVVVQDPLGKLKVYSTEGKMIGKELSVETNGYLEFKRPVIADLDGDGEKEIISFGGTPNHSPSFIAQSAAQSLLYVSSFDPVAGPSLKWAIPVPNVDGVFGGCVAADLDQTGDGTKEIVISAIHYRLNSPRDLVGYSIWYTRVYNHQGNLLWAKSNWPENVVQKGWRLAFGGGSITAPLPAVGNLDDDPELEIVSIAPFMTDWQRNLTNTTHYYVAAFNADGSYVNSSFPKMFHSVSGQESDSVTFASPVIGDVNRDHAGSEIVLGTVNGLFVLDGTGEVLWDTKGTRFSPNTVEGFHVVDKHVIGGDIILSDLVDGSGNLGQDGYAEIIFTDRFAPYDGYETFSTHVYAGDGSQIKSIAHESNTFAIAGRSNTVVDLNGDDKMEIVSLTYADPKKANAVIRLQVHVWNLMTEQVLHTFEFYRTLPYDMPAVDDLDGDGIPEVLVLYFHQLYNKREAGRVSLGAWELPSQFSNGPMKSDWPMYRHDSSLTGNYALQSAPSDTTAPALMSAVSLKTHGAAGGIGIPLALDNAQSTIECRKDGPTEIVLTFSEPVKARDGTLDASEVNLSAGVLGGVSTQDNTLTVSLSGVPDRTYVTLTLLAGLTDLADNPLSGDPDVKIGVLRGDVNADKTVNIVDLSNIKMKLASMSAPPTPVDSNTVRLDVNSDGVITVADINAAKTNLFKKLP